MFNNHKTINDEQTMDMLHLHVIIMVNLDGVATTIAITSYSRKIQIEHEIGKMMTDGDMGLRIGHGCMMTCDHVLLTLASREMMMEDAFMMFVNQLVIIIMVEWQCLQYSHHHLVLTMLVTDLLMVLLAFTVIMVIS